MALTSTLVRVITAAISAAVRDMFVALPGTVVSAAEDGKTCSVTPGVHRVLPVDGDDEFELSVEKLPVLQNVPVIWTVGRNVRIKGELAAGDSVLLVGLDRDPSNWRRTASPSEPNDLRNHDLAFAVAIPGLVPDSDPTPDPSDAAALASVVLANLNTLRTQINKVQSQLAAHSHSVSGSATTGTTVPPTPPAVGDTPAMTNPASTTLLLGS